MKYIGIRKSFIIAVACSGAVLNLAYSIDILRAFLNLQHSTSVREIMISAIVLEIGWATLLVWVVLRPFEKYPILLFTIAPILFGNLLHSFNQLGADNANSSAILVNTVFGLFYSGLYVLAFIVGKGVNNENSHHIF